MPAYIEGTLTKTEKLTSKSNTEGVRLTVSTSSGDAEVVAATYNTQFGRGVYRTSLMLKEGEKVRLETGIKGFIDNVSRM